MEVMTPVVIERQPDLRALNPPPTYFLNVKSNTDLRQGDENAEKIQLQRKRDEGSETKTESE